MKNQSKTFSRTMIVYYLVRVAKFTAFVINTSIWLQAIVNSIFFCWRAKCFGICFQRVLTTNWEIICLPSADVVECSFFTFFTRWAIFRYEQFHSTRGRSEFWNNGQFMCAAKDAHWMAFEWNNSNLNCAQTGFSYYPFIIVITCIVIVHLSAEQITITLCTMDIIRIEIILVQEGDVLVFLSCV